MDTTTFASELSIEDVLSEQGSDLPERNLMKLHRRRGHNFNNTHQTNFGGGVNINNTNQTNFGGGVNINNTNQTNFGGGVNINNTNQTNF